MMKSMSDLVDRQCRVYLVNGNCLEGTVHEPDEDFLRLSSRYQEPQRILWHAISSITPVDSVRS